MSAGPGMEDLSGKVCLVTGATSGIGQATALDLARLGASVVVAGRDQQKCEQVVAHLRRESANPAVVYLLADLSAMEQVRELARQFQEKYSRLDVLVNNAGGFFMRREVSAEGLEMTFALNHLSYFLLTLLLLDTLKASAPARIVNVSSDSHRGQQLDFDDLQLEHGYNGPKAYGRSKLANVLFTYELARQLAGTGVTANALHPGLVYTNLWGRVSPWLKPLFVPILRLVAKPPQEGAWTCLYLAASAEVEGVSGRYFVDEKAVRSDPASYDEEAARRLWDRSLALAGIISAE